MTWISRLAGGVAVLAVSSLLAGPALAGGSSAPPPAPKKWLPWIEGGGFLSTEQHRGESNLFAPIWQSSVALLFFQGTGKYFEDDIREGNFAIGFRKMQRSGWNFGLWGGYDVRHSEFDNTFHQIAFGFEALSDRWDVRANGYVAVSDPEASPDTARVFLSGNTILMTGGEEVPLSGFDGEVGYKLFSTRGRHGGGFKDGPARQGRSHELRVYAGGFYFDDGDALEEVAGPRARIEWRIDDVFRGLPGSRLTLEGEFQYDEVREDQWEGGVRLRIPFGGGGRDARATLLASLTPQERRMTESLVRDTDIVTAASEEENVIDTATNVLFNQAAVASTADDVANAVAIGPNTLIVVQGKGGVIDVSATEGQALQASQTLQGGGSTINVRGAKSGVVLPFTAPGARPTLFSNDGNANTGVVTVASNTHVVGLDVQGAGGVGVGIVGNHGIRGLGGLSNVVIERNAVSNTGDDSVDFEDNNGNMTLSGNTIANTRDRGVQFGNNNNDVTVSDNTIANTNFIGVNFGDNNSNVTISGNSISNTDNEGVRFQDNNSNVTVSGNTIADVDDTGVQFSDNNSNVTISGNTIVNTRFQGVRFQNNNSTVTVSGNTIRNTDDQGVAFFNNNSSVTVSGNTISNTGGDGVIIFNFSGNTNLTLSDNTFSGIGDDVFDFIAAGNTLLPGSTGNVVTDAPGDLLCEGAGNFTGTFEITDQNGVLQTFTNGC